MTGGKKLLLLAVFVLLARCEKPTVTMSPALKQIFTGDIFYLSCGNSASGITVKWYFNNKQTQTSNTWRIAVAGPNNSGSYQCEHGGQKSDSKTIEVLDYVPSASLTIVTGLPVIRTKDVVVLKLDNEDGLLGWKCWNYKGNTTTTITFKNLKNGSSSHVFQSPKLVVPEAILWCGDNTTERRSNQIMLRSTDKIIMLEMDPVSAVFGESLTVRCYVDGPFKIHHTIFYENNTSIVSNNSPTHKISNVTESAKGRYRCNATYRNINSQNNGPSQQMISDYQEIFVQAPPKKAVLYKNSGLSCSCPLCLSDSSYRWYHKKDGGKSWTRMDFKEEWIRPTASGTYACQAVWKNMKSLISDSYDFSDEPPIKSILLAVVIVLLILGCAVGAYILYKKRNTTAPIYEDVELRYRDKGGAKMEGEYDTIQTTAPSKEKKEGEYEALKKEEMKEGVYHSVGMEGAVRGEGGYEALKKEGMKEGVYHTLGMEGAVGAEGGYEALKKEGMKEGEYHTVRMEGAVRGEGGYEALKKAGMKEGVYHTLGMEEAVGSEGGYEALKKEGMKEGEYQTLGKEGGAVGMDKDKECEIVEEKKQAKAEEQKAEP